MRHLLQSGNSLGIHLVQVISSRITSDNGGMSTTDGAMETPAREFCACLFILSLVYLFVFLTPLDACGKKKEKSSK